MSKNNPLQYALWLLQKKDFSQYEMLQKLNKQDFAKTEIEDAVKYLLSKDFLNDRRLAANIINFYHSKKGEIWIKQKAQTRGISQQTFMLAWEEFVNSLENTTDYSQIKKRVMQKYKIENFKNLDYKIYQKVFGYLTYHGFSASDLISRWQNE